MTANMHSILRRSQQFSLAVCAFRSVARSGQWRGRGFFAADTRIDPDLFAQRPLHGDRSSRHTLFVAPILVAIGASESQIGSPA